MTIAVQLVRLEVVIQQMRIEPIDSLWDHNYNHNRQLLVYTEWNFANIRDNYNTPLEHTPGNLPRELWKESLYI